MKPVFLSVGSKLSDRQEEFISALEARLRAEGLEPRCLGRNHFSADAPFRAINSLMSECEGVVVAGLERKYFERGFERPNTRYERLLTNARYCTPWNQIEAALGYARNLPLLVIVEAGVFQEGLLEPGNDWYVLSVPIDPSFLSMPEFNGVLSSWCKKVHATNRTSITEEAPNPSELSVGKLLGSLNPQQLWAVLGSAAVVVAGASALGAKLFP